MARIILMLISLLFFFGGLYEIGDILRGSRGGGFGIVALAIVLIILGIIGTIVSFRSKDKY